MREKIKQRCENLQRVKCMNRKFKRIPLTLLDFNINKHKRTKTSPDQGHPGSGRKKNT